MTTALEAHFQSFRDGIVGIDATFDGPYGTKRILYADWTASGRLYRPIEERMLNEFGPYVANTHTETTTTGEIMTLAYHEAKHIIKQHVNAHETDCLIAFGSGMTGVVNRLQRMLGLRVPEQVLAKLTIAETERPAVFITHMEHHSNQTSWIETIADVFVIAPDENGLVDLQDLEAQLYAQRDRRVKIAAVTACSNVTGIEPPYHAIAEIMHRNGGVCFVDFACSAPYVAIDMHPANPLQKLDAIYFSPHKFLGGPGTPGILLFDPVLYGNRVPDSPGGGTVKWTNPWKEHEYLDSIEEREDGGTPPFLGTIRIALAIQLKEQMGMEQMQAREEQLLSEIIFPRLKQIPNLHLLAGEHEHRLGVISFYIDGLHYNLGARMLNDRFGMQTRSGCSCAGTYGHYLLHVDKQHSKEITDEIHRGNLSLKPGWMRFSIHPTMTNSEVVALCDAIEELAAHFVDWQNDYVYSSKTNEFTHRSKTRTEEAIVKKLFHLEQNVLSVA